jgi:hypothetical protein
MRGFFPLCHCFRSFWHYGIAGQYMTTALGGGFLSLNKNGIELSKILDKTFCSNDVLKDFVEKRLEEKQKIGIVEILKNDLLKDNNKKIIEILKEKLLSDGYNEETIDKILINLIIEYKDNTIQNIPRTKNVKEEQIAIKPSENIVLEFVPSDETAFKEKLIETKRAKRTFYYSNNQYDDDIWFANNFTEHSNLRGNIWGSSIVKKKGLKKIKFEILER